MPQSFAPGGTVPALAESPAISIASNAALMEAERLAEDRAAQDRSPVVSSIAAHIRRRWEDAKRAKSDIETKMLSALRQRVGEYEPDKLAQIRKMGSSEVFVRLTDQKCTAAAAWIRDVLSLDRPWGLEPTPKPTLPPAVVDRIEADAIQQVMMQIQMGSMPLQGFDLQGSIAELVNKGIKKEAQDRSARMEQIIDDYLREGGFREQIGLALDWDLVTFGTAILRSPVVRQRRDLTWAVDEMGTWTLQEEQSSYPAVERVSPLDFYPSDDATTVGDASYLLEKYPLSRASLAAFKGQESWNDKEIDAVLTEYGQGGLREWTTTDTDRALLAERSDAGQYTEKIDALIFWGELQGKLLLDWGIKSVEPLSEYAVEAWLIGSHVVRVEIKEPHMLARPYQKAVYRHRPGSFWGLGVPEVMADVQAQANAAARALANNMAFASGPQVGIDIEQMPPGEDGSRIWPWKVWRFNTGKFGNTNTPPISFFQPDMHAMELMQIYEKWARIADEATSIPAYVQGDTVASGAGKTASGLSMLMGAATKTIKTIVANIDVGLIEPLVRGFFRFAMLYHPDDSAKGDCQVVAKGSTALLVREQAQIRRNEFLQTTNNPVDLQIMGIGRRAELLRSVAETLSLSPDDVAPTREEMDKQQQTALSPPPDGQPGAALGPDGQPVAGQDFRLMTPGG
mgnify:CR=1 FL=1